MALTSAKTGRREVLARGFMVQYLSGREHFSDRTTSVDFSFNGNYGSWEFKNCSANGSQPSRADEEVWQRGQRNTTPHIK